jgi:hypothetical protein
VPARPTWSDFTRSHTCSLCIGFGAAHQEGAFSGILSTQLKVGSPGPAFIFDVLSERRSARRPMESPCATATSMCLLGGIGTRSRIRSSARSATKRAGWLEIKIAGSRVRAGRTLVGHVNDDSGGVLGALLRDILVVAVGHEPAPSAISLGWHLRSPETARVNLIGARRGPLSRAVLVVTVPS